MVMVGIVGVDNGVSHDEHIVVADVNTQEEFKAACSKKLLVYSDDMIEYIRDLHTVLVGEIISAKI